jgi:hypothetical protein
MSWQESIFYRQLIDILGHLVDRIPKGNTAWWNRAYTRKGKSRSYTEIGCEHVKCIC